MALVEPTCFDMSEVLNSDCIYKRRESMFNSYGLLGHILLVFLPTQSNCVMFWSVYSVCRFYFVIFLSDVLIGNY